MKVRIIKDGQSGPNPAWTPKSPKSVPHSIPVPRGFVIDHPDAKYLVRTGVAEKYAGEVKPGGIALDPEPAAAPAEPAAPPADAPAEPAAASE